MGLIKQNNNSGRAALILLQFCCSLYTTTTTRKCQISRFKEEVNDGRRIFFHGDSRVKMNSTNWPSLNGWVFIAQFVEQCSANAEAMGSNPVDA